MVFPVFKDKQRTFFLGQFLILSSKYCFIATTIDHISWSITSMYYMAGKKLNDLSIIIEPLPFLNNEHCVKNGTKPE